MNAPIVEAYVTNAPMRESYFRLNGMVRVEAWDADDDEPGYMPALCGSDGCGWPERSRVFATIGQCAAWAAKYCPELPFIA